MLFLGKLFQVVVIDGLGFLGYAVGHNAISLSGKVEMVTVCKVASVRQVQAENGIARLQDGGVRLHIGLRSGVRLDVGVVCSEKLFRALSGQVLDDVCELAAAVIAFPRIALGVLIRK